ncbi:Fic family protein [Rhodohalobacter sp. 8-1]|uniref:Fic family protein n=1 Tax=Rhodohalobacter sp. 8-1 TaxID=3131972 RepID=UPI0030EE3BB1
MNKNYKAEGEVKGEVRGEATEKSLNDTERAILKLLEKGPSSAEELANELGLKSRSGFFTRTLRGLMKGGFIEYKYPESPRHPDQKYRLSSG